jgi:beta-glucosidase-like glycosyl hydrolase
MMLSHNDLLGTQMHANHEIMTEHFRERLEYEGFFASDLGNIEAVWQNSLVAANYSDAVALSLWAGMDQSFDSSGNGFDPSRMYPAVCHYMIQPLVELYEDCMVMLKVS